MSDASRRLAAHEQKGNGRLWFAVLAGPAAWVLQLYTGAYLTDVLCLPGAGSSKGEIYSLRNTAFVSGLTAAAALGALAGLAVSIAALRRCNASDDSTPERRATWMARAGIIVNVLFLVLIVSMFVASHYLRECVGSL